MMYYRISKNEKNLFFGKKNRPSVGSDLNCNIYDAQRRKRALKGGFSHFQFLTFFNRYMFKLLICVLFVRKLYTSVLKYGFVWQYPLI